MDLEKTDLSALQKTGWKLPETFCVKAADGVTDLYGNMWKPFDFDPKKKYPIIAHVYPGPQTGGRDAHASPRTARNMQLAQLGLHRHPGRPPRRHAGAVEGVPQLRLLQPARLRPGRQEGRDRAARRAAPLHRHRPRRHLRPLRRRVHVGRGAAAEAVQRVLQGRGRVGRQPRQQHLQRQLVRALPRPEGSSRRARTTRTRPTTGKGSTGGKGFGGGKGGGRKKGPPSRRRRSRPNCAT